MGFGRNDMQRVNGLRIEEESRRKNEETETRLGRGVDFDTERRMGRANSILTRIRRSIHR
jgi:hypothetical protein